MAEIILLLQSRSCFPPFGTLPRSSSSPALSPIGKTTVSTNSPMVLAQKDGRVLLVDADLSWPGVGKALDIKTTAGLTTLLSGMDKAGGAVVPFPQLPNFQVLRAGPILRTRWNCWAVAARIGVKLSAASRRAFPTPWRVTRELADDPVAYDAYIRGRSWLGSWNAQPQISETLPQGWNPPLQSTAIATRGSSNTGSARTTLPEETNSTRGKPSACRVMVIFKAVPRGRSESAMMRAPHSLTLLVVPRISLLPCP